MSSEEHPTDPAPLFPLATVAIVMRTKNRALLLERALRDVLAQDYQDWSLVVVNDGGEPALVDDLLQKYAAAAHGRFHAIHNAASVGMEAASNQGIRATASRYISIHDDDDEWAPDFLTVTVDELERSGGPGVMVRTEIVFERIVGTSIEVDERVIFEPNSDQITLFKVLKYNRGVPISFLYRRSVHADIGYYDETLPAVGDWEFHLRFLRKMPIAFIDGKPRAFWNQRRESIGDMGNSVVARDHDHQKYDLAVREEYLREYAQTHGLGALLYLTKVQEIHSGEHHARADHADQLLGEVLELMRSQSERISRLETAVSDASLTSLLRRRYRRLKDRCPENVPRVGAR